MLTYNRVRGEWSIDSAVVISGCYAGHGEGLNNPAMEAVRDVGPLPANVYQLGPVHKIDKIGLAMTLTPLDLSKMHGRAGFLVHLTVPHDVSMVSSHGCICMENDADILERIAKAGGQVPSYNGISGYQKLMKIEQLRAGGQDKVTVE